ncbi:MAG: tetratricopeptide repeat protein, partial [Bacteroidota bacterium]
KAIEVYVKLEKMTGIHEETVRHKHLLYMGLGDYKKAAKEIENLIAAFPKNTAHRHTLATFYEQINDLAKAKEIYRQILNLDPGDARAAIALAEESKGNDDQRFLTSLKPVFENPKTDIDTKIKEILPYVNRLAETGDQSLAASLLALTGILERVHPNSAKAFSVLADVLFYSGDKEKALAKYQKTLELDDNIWLVWEQVLNLLAEQKDYDQLIATAEKALDIFPNQATAFYFLGVGHNGEGKHKDALDALQQALIMASRNPRLRYDVLNETGLAYFHLKQYSQSDNAFEEALKIAGNEPLALINYSHTLAARNEKLDKAKELATHLNELAPNVPRHEAALAFVFYKMKDFKAAKDLLAKALAHGGEGDPAVLEQFGDVSFQLGNSAEAVQYWQRAVEKGGKSELLEKKVADGKLYE